MQDINLSVITNAYPVPVGAFSLYALLSQSCTLLVHRQMWHSICILLCSPQHKLYSLNAIAHIYPMVQSYSNDMDIIDQLS